MDTLAQLPDLELVIPGYQSQRHWKVSLMPLEEIYSLSSLSASRELTHWRVTIKNQYFTAYTQGYYNAAAWGMDHEKPDATFVT